MTVTWKCNRRNGSEREERRREKAIQTQKGRVSGGGRTIEWSRGGKPPYQYISVRQDDRVGGPKRAVNQSLLLTGLSTVCKGS